MDRELVNTETELAVDVVWQQQKNLVGIVALSSLASGVQLRNQNLMGGGRLLARDPEEMQRFVEFCKDITRWYRGYSAAYDEE